LPVLETPQYEWMKEKNGREEGEFGRFASEMNGQLDFFLPLMRAGAASSSSPASWKRRV
jgi:hypothetical protein